MNPRLGQASSIKLCLATFACAALLAATLVGWAGSYVLFEVKAVDGKLWLFCVRALDDGVHDHLERTGGSDAVSAILHWRGLAQTRAEVLGLEYFWNRPIIAGVAIPFAYIACALAVAFAWCARALLVRRRRGRLGLCLRCGYDLRHTTGVCPECGDAAGGDASTARPRTPTIMEDNAREADPDVLPAAVGRRDAGGERLRESKRTV